MSESEVASSKKPEDREDKTLIRMEALVYDSKCTQAYPGGRGAIRVEIFKNQFF